MKPTARNIERLTIGLGMLKADLKEARKRERTALRLLERAFDAIPWYTDGRNDRLEREIEKLLSDKNPIA